MKLFLAGLNHKTAPVRVRECLAPAAEELPAALERIMSLKGVREAVMISTCNRVEALVAMEDGSKAADSLIDLMVSDKPIAAPEMIPCFYTYLNQQAVAHLFRVASSLDSMVVGEPQILGQIKEAYRAASSAGTSGAVLNRLMHKTFQVAKRVRTETRIGGAAVSISYAAVELAKKIFEDLSGLNALLIGAGEMAELAAEHLMGQGLREVSVANRTLERATSLAGRFGGNAYPLSQLKEALFSSDIAICSTGASRPIIDKALAREVMKNRRGKPVFFIDIAVPRDIEAAAAQVDGCYVYDIDDLSQVVDDNKKARAQEAERAEVIVAKEVIKFNAWLESLKAAPTISELTQKGEEIRLGEIERSKKELGELSPAQARALDNLTHAIVKKLLHDPIMFLKEETHDKKESTRQGQLALMRRIFRLGQNGEG